ncbi:hypothetical protein L1887_09663 [Cichorium endivia]|nr:hypothetical protein L1887_09663 [Cichorium endivia]
MITSCAPPSSAPGFILMELKQAKLNLTRTTNDIADIRATVEIYNKKIEKERFELEKIRQIAARKLKESQEILRIGIQNWRPNRMRSLYPTLELLSAQGIADCMTLFMVFPF